MDHQHPTKPDRKTGKKRTLSKKPSDWILFVIFTIGLGLLVYPAVSELWNTLRSRSLEQQYQQVIIDSDPEKSRQLLEAAQAYNASHTHLALDSIYQGEEGEEGISEDSEYRQFLSLSGSTTIGVLNIPKIAQKLMIYYGTGEEALSKGAGHMEGSSLPVGGKSTHAVLAAHRGLPSAKLFTDLDQMEEGDLFTLDVLGQKLAYRVIRIQTVEAEDTDAVEIEPGKDLVTLLTCTPYGVNTERLLVTGERTDYTQEIEDELNRQENDSLNLWNVVLLAAALIAEITAALFLLFPKQKQKNSRSKQHQQTKDRA